MNYVKSGLTLLLITDKNPGGNILLYQVFNDYRRMLKGAYTKSVQPK